MTVDVHTHQPRRIRSDAAIASLPADAPMSMFERYRWYELQGRAVQDQVTAAAPVTPSGPRWAGYTEA